MAPKGKGGAAGVVTIAHLSRAAAVAAAAASSEVRR